MKESLISLTLFLSVLPGFSQQTIELNDWKLKTGDNPEWAKPGFNDSEWKTIQTGADWASQGYKGYSGYAWYRMKFSLPATMKKLAFQNDCLQFLLHKINDCDQTFLNGRMLGNNDKLFAATEPTLLNDLNGPGNTGNFWITRKYTIPLNDLRLLWGQENILCVRVYIAGNESGIWSVKAALKGLTDYVTLEPDPNSLQTNPDGSLTETIILKNISTLPEISGTLTMQITNAENKQVIAQQTYKVSLGKTEKKYAVKFKDAHAMMKATYRFTESRSKALVVYTGEFSNRWTEKQANEWFATNGWLRGCNFIPSTAINQIEMWQAETFDPVTIDRELGWAASLGFNAMRVFLNHKVWLADAGGLKKRIGQYLAIASKHDIKTIFVFFDDCHYPTSQLGKQPDPRPVHNCGWVQDPGLKESADTTYYPVLEKYVKDIMNTFASDKRIVLWDLYNEPGNSWRDHGDTLPQIINAPWKGIRSLKLEKKMISWARATKATQPITIDIGWINLTDFELRNSDIITYHHYGNGAEAKAIIDGLRKYNRPIIFTEYLARPGCTFSDMLPMLAKEKVGAINWGLVWGKTNTIYASDDRSHTDGSEPKDWFHDILRKDGTPYLQEEVDLIRRECLNKKL